MCNDHDCMCYDGEAYNCIADLERQLAGMNIILKDARAEIESMRPTFEWLNDRHRKHNYDFDCSCDTCGMWRDYEARKPK